VKFWDTSAVVPLLVHEPETARIKRLAENDPAIVVWWATRTECVSALARLRRAAALRAPDEAGTRRLLMQLSAAWTEIVPARRLRDRAERLLSLHALRAGDAFQLAAALVWSRGRTTGRGFVSFDGRLRAAATREGFDVFPLVGKA
jgi:predicted nucleic acid-binding protein